MEWNLSKTAICGPVIIDLFICYRERWLLYRGRLHCFSAMLVLFGSARLWVREVALSYSDNLRLVPLIIV